MAALSSASPPAETAAGLSGALWFDAALSLLADPVSVASGTDTVALALAFAECAARPSAAAPAARLAAEPLWRKRRKGGVRGQLCTMRSGYVHPTWS